MFAVLSKSGAHDDMMSSAFQASLQVALYFAIYMFTCFSTNARENL